MMFKSSTYQNIGRFFFCSWIYLDENYRILSWYVSKSIRQVSVQDMQGIQYVIHF